MALSPTTSRGSSLVQTALVTLNNAAIKTLPSVTLADGGVTVVPSPGAGKLLVFLGGHILFTFPAGDASAMYVADPAHVDDAILMLVLGGGNQTQMSNAINVSLLLGANFSVATGYHQASLGVPAFPPGVYTTDYLREVSSAADTPNSTPSLSLAANGQNFAVPDFTGGNAANTLRITAFYSVIDYV